MPRLRGAMLLFQSPSDFIFTQRSRAIRRRRFRQDVDLLTPLYFQAHPLTSVPMAATLCQIFVDVIILSMRVRVRYR
jgi:hypothetical protein